MSLSYEPALSTGGRTPRYRGSLTRKSEQTPFVTIKYQDKQWGFEDWRVPSFDDEDDR